MESGQDRGGTEGSRLISAEGGGGAMFDCMEALGMGPRQLYDVTSRGACMLRKASPFFAGLDPFAWTGSASVQCKWHPVWISCMTP